LTEVLKIKGLAENRKPRFSGEGGIRTPLKTPENSAILDERAAKSDALAVTDLDLLHVVRSWPVLPDPIRLAVLALVRSRLA
jgi:hypothetical protein